MPDHRRKDADRPSPVAAAEGTAAGMSSEHHCPGSSPAGNYYSGEPAPDIAVALVNVAGNLSHLWRRAGVNAIRNQHDVTLVLFCLLCVQGLFGREECRADRGVSAGNQAVDLGSNFVARTAERHQGLDVFTTGVFFFVTVSSASTVGQQSKLLVTRQFAEEGVCHTVGSVGA